MPERRLRLGVAGLGRGFTVMLPTLAGDPRVQLVAAADPRPDARQKFAADFGATSYATVEELCADPSVEVVYVATPHELHAAHVCAAAAKGKHVLVEKPMAITLHDCQTMIAAARQAKVQLIVGHSHSFNAPVRRAREIIASGAVGRVRMINALNFTDFLYRPRRPEELVTEKGGGVVFSQAAHQIDIVRLLGGGRVRSVRAATGSWDPKRPTEGAYTAFLSFADGAFATATYSGYAHFDSDEFCNWIGELGRRKDPRRYGAARKMLQGVASPDQEASLKAARNYGGDDDASGPAAQAGDLFHQHFGMLIASCEGADLRPLPTGVMIYDDAAPRLDALPPPGVPRAEVIDELYDAVVLGKPPVHSGEWALATLEVCLAILRSAREQTEIALQHQIAVPA
ncbi:MAG TPA: Gfo/Idh/MocA family oxidoreductase [Alphaproteobacteria bacterium]